MELAQQNKNDEALALFNSDYNDATEKLQDILVDIGKVASAEAKSQYTSARVTGIVSIILMILMAGLNITRLLGIVISSDIVGRGPDFDGRPQHVGIYLDLFGDLLYQAAVFFR